MSRFYVGQRVKKVRGDRNIGLTGVVVGNAFFAGGHHAHHPSYPFGFELISPSDLQVLFDGNWEGVVGGYFSAGDVAFCDAHNFEPIQPSGAQPSEFTTLHELLDSLELVPA
jgi:hypothetical protein